MCWFTFGCNSKHDVNTICSSYLLLADCGSAWIIQVIYFFVFYHLSSVTEIISGLSFTSPTAKNKYKEIRITSLTHIVQNNKLTLDQEPLSL